MRPAANDLLAHWFANFDKFSESLLVFDKYKNIPSKQNPLVSKSKIVVKNIWMDLSKAMMAPDVCEKYKQDI